MISRNRIFIFLIAAMAVLPTDVSAAAPASSSDKLVVGAMDIPPLLIKGDNGRWEGLGMDLWRAAASEMGVDFEIKEFETIDGIIAAVRKKEIDVLPAITVTLTYEPNLDFTNHYARSGSAIAIRMDDAGSGWLGLAGRVISWPFFAAVGSLFLLWGIAGTLVWVFENRRNSEMFGGGHLKGLGHGIWWAAVTMTTVGYGDKAPKTPGGRIVAAIWMFVSILLISSFTATITTSLTLNELKGRVRGVGDLPVVRVGTLAQSSVEASLAGKGLSVISFRNNREGLQALADDKIDAFVHDEFILKYLARNEFPSHIYVLPETFNHYYVSMAVPQSHHLREPLNRAILKFMGTDQWEKMVRRYLGQ